MSQNNNDLKAEQNPLFGIIDDGFKYTEQVINLETRPLSSWNKLLITPPFELQPDCIDFFRSFHEGLSPFSNCLINSVGNQISSQLGSSGFNVDDIFHNAWTEVKYEVDWQEFLNNYPDQVYRKLKLREQFVAKRISYDAEGIPQLQTINNGMIGLNAAERMAEFDEEQLYILEKLVRPVVSRQRSFGLESLLNLSTSELLRDIYNITDFDTSPQALKPGNRSAWLGITPTRRGLIDLDKYDYSFFDEVERPVLQRQDLENERVRGTNGIFATQEVQRSRMAAAAGIGKMLHEGIYQGLEADKQPDISILKVLLKGYSELSASLKVGGKLIPAKQLQEALSNPNKDVMDSGIWQKLRTTAQIFSRLYLQRYLFDGTEFPDVFTAELKEFFDDATLPYLTAGVNFSEGIFSEALDANQELQSKWQKRGQIETRGTIENTTVFTNLLTDTINDFTGFNITNLAAVYPTDYDISELVTGFSDLEGGREKFELLENQVVIWMLDNHKNDVIRQMFSLMLLSEVVESNPLQEYGEKIFTEVRIPPNKEDEDSYNRYADAVVLLDMDNSVIDRRGIPLDALLVDYDGRIKIIEIKTVNKAHGDHKKRTQPRKEDVIQMNQYLERIAHDFPYLPLPEVEFMYVSLEGISKVKGYPDVDTWLLKH